MTPHPDYVPLIVRAADGALEPRDRAQLDEHLSACADCRDALAAQLEMRALLEQRPVQRASPDFVRRVRASLPTERTAWVERWDFRGWTWRLAPVAALLLVVTVSIVRHTAVTTTNSGTIAGSAVDASVSSALWSSSVSDTSMLSLMIYAQADDTLASHLKDQPQ